MEAGKILTAIREAERDTTGEIRVHVARHFWDPKPEGRALALFRRYGMSRTSRRNAVLFYFNLSRRRFALVYDQGFTGVVDDSYWRGLARNLEEDLKCTHYENAIALAVRTLGETLKHYFPPDR